MPTPKKGESEADFVKRCIPIVLDDETAKDGKQAAAICHSMWRESKKGQNMRTWFTMRAPTGDEAAVISIYDEIGRSFWGEDSISAKGFLESLAELGDVKNITLRINSPGGDVFDGVAIHNALKNHPAKVTAHIDGIAASIASFIAMAADKIVMPANSFMLLHNASGMAMGNADDMRALADDLDRIDKSMAATYAARSGQSTAKVRALLKEDRLMDAKEAKELGYADSVGEAVKMAASFPLRLLPKAVAERFKAEIGEPPANVDDLPPPVVVPEEPEPATPPAPPTPAPTAEVISFAKAKQSGVAEHKAYVDTVTDLCVLAGMADRVGAYVRDEKPVEEVRKELLKARTEVPPVMPHHPLMEKPAPTKLWDKITDTLNARSIRSTR